MTTIKATFDPTTLPAWAQKDEAVRWLVEQDLGFRADVFSATETQYQRHLKRTAETRFDAFLNR